MKTRVTRARLLVGGLVLGGLLVGVQPQAQAHCLYLELYVKRSNTDPYWVHGQHNPCVIPTDWGYGLTHVEDNNTTVTGHPDGAPSGFYVKVRLPTP